MIILECLLVLMLIFTFYKIIHFQNVKKKLYHIIFVRVRTNCYVLQIIKKIRFYLFSYFKVDVHLFLFYITRNLVALKKESCCKSYTYIWHTLRQFEVYVWDVSIVNNNILFIIISIIKTIGVQADSLNFFSFLWFFHYFN